MSAAKIPNQGGLAQADGFLRVVIPVLIVLILLTRYPC
jgi:hypothetical protein